MRTPAVPGTRPAPGDTGDRTGGHRRGSSPGRPARPRESRSLPLRDGIGRWLIWVEVIGVGGLVVLAAIGPRLPGHWVPVAVAAAVLVVIPLLRLRGRSLLRWLAGALRFLPRRRRGVLRRIQRATPSGANVDQPVAAVPSLFGMGNITTVTAHDGRQVAAVQWHGSYSTMLRAEPARRGIAGPAALVGVDLSAVADALESSDIKLASAQIITHSYPGTDLLPVDSMALRAQQQLAIMLPFPPRRTVAVTLRLDPRACPHAIAARGGGVTGTVKCLAAVGARLSAALAADGVALNPVDGAALARAVPAWADLPAVSEADAPAWQERWTTFVGGDLVHRSYKIAGGLRNRAALDDLNYIRAMAVTTSLTLRPVAYGRVVVDCVVRLTTRTPAEMTAADSELRRRIRAGRLRLVRLSGGQREALLATLPTGRLG